LITKGRRPQKQPKNKERAISDATRTAKKRGEAFGSRWGGRRAGSGGLAHLEKGEERPTRRGKRMTKGTLVNPEENSGREQGPKRGGETKVLRGKTWERDKPGWAEFPGVGKNAQQKGKGKTIRETKTIGCTIRGGKKNKKRSAGRKKENPKKKGKKPSFQMKSARRSKIE